ncbi:ABC transporter substrate-binding protein [Nonomuraea soli]|uniref:NitT/TauT family transport system substrate-binding protein n=1 Tax=Nonomuraea soli TaxID=1032476 RepID=A0A7W0CLR6_9ACTN|nr:ABC transporter substrate-binding protein [Nonomuraea soli]MBA2893270.1 NitT/TauT family transport system substrate-binding protein [Nonomuraea soli]
MALTLAACSNSAPSESAGAASGPLEKTTLNIGITPTPSSAPVFIAMKRNFFKEEGLTVKTTVIQAPQAAMPLVANGSMDIFKGSYVSMLNIQDAGQKLKILSDTLQGAPGIAGVVVAKGSRIQTAEDLKGKTIAVNSLKNLGELSVSAHLQINSLTPTDVKFVVFNFDKQLPALFGGQVDAAWLVEPFLTAAQQEGARLLLDTNSGPTDALPIDGWGTTEDWAAKHPKTAAAFQRAVTKAQRLAATDRSALADVVPEYTQIPKVAVMTMAMGTFPTSLNASRIQRVADLMYDFGYLKNKIDVESMIFQGAAQ